MARRQNLLDGSMQGKRIEDLGVSIGKIQSNITARVGISTATIFLESKLVKCIKNFKIVMAFDQVCPTILMKRLLYESATTAVLLCNKPLPNLVIYSDKQFS